jgi:hypothetical protein
MAYSYINHNPQHAPGVYNSETKSKHLTGVCLWARSYFFSHLPPFPGLFQISGRAFLWFWGNMNNLFERTWFIINLKPTALNLRLAPHPQRAALNTNINTGGHCAKYCTVNEGGKTADRQRPRSRSKIDPLCRY